MVIEQDKNAGVAGGTHSAMLRSLPSIDSLLLVTTGQRLVATYGHTLTVDALREALQTVRQGVLAGSSEVPTSEMLLEWTEANLQSLVSSTLLPVINATGVIIHTNLGRAPLSEASVHAVAKIAKGYSNLEYDLEIGGRGSRADHAEKLLTHLTGAQAALAVNNNAAAVLLMLAALCRDREVIISRGQLVEIGGGFRIPDVMAQSGAKLVEVGTTNRTHLADYERAISADTAAILVAHHSNFRIVGFASEPGLAELSFLAEEKGVLLLYDQGSGALRDVSPYGLSAEPTVQDAVAAGVSLVAFSGDKLLGGPQAGILVGEANLIEQIKRHPLARAVRADKMCLAALTETLKAYQTGRITSELPVWQMISASLVTISNRATSWSNTLRRAGLRVKIVDGYSTIGGGSLPGSMLATQLVLIETDSAEQLARDLRGTTPPVVARILEDRLALDPRTVIEDQDELLLDTVIRCAGRQLTTFL